jgi:hypothetical protein
LLTSLGTAQVIEAPYDAAYTYADLGSVPGLPPLYGGLTFKYDDPNTLLIGGNANDAPGALYAISVVRDAQNHVTGFSGTASFFCDAAFNDGGVIYGPDNVLFLARWPSNELGFTKVGSTITDKIVDLTPFGVGLPSSSQSSALNFVPAGFPGAGQLKLVSWPGGEWYTVAFSPDGLGTFDVNSVTPGPTLPGGPEGFIYVPDGSPVFKSGTNLLLSEFSDGNVVTYKVDANGDPIVATRALFISGLEGAEGALIDPLTGDFLFSTFGGGDRVIVVQGFSAPTCQGTVFHYGPTRAGSGGFVPTIEFGGCPGQGQDVTIEIANCLGGAQGCLVLGSGQGAIPLASALLLVDPVQQVYCHTLGGAPKVPGAGSLSLPFTIPIDPVLHNAHIYAQAGYLDFGAELIIALSDALDLTVD